jgi:hypothetical protein
MQDTGLPLRRRPRIQRHLIVHTVLVVQHKLLCQSNDPQANHRPERLVWSSWHTRADTPSRPSAQASSCQTDSRSPRPPVWHLPYPQQCGQCPSRRCDTRCDTPCTCALCRHYHHTPITHTIRVLVTHKHQVHLVLIDQLLKCLAHVQRHNVVALLLQLRCVLRT